MRENLGAALIIALGIVAAAQLLANQLRPGFVIQTIPEGALRLDSRTGSIDLCNASGCKVVALPGPGKPTADTAP